MKYEKPFLTLDQQADLLIKQRGMDADRASLITHLADVGYYRLSGYWHIFRLKNDDRFQAGTSFNQIWTLYTFDRQFRLVVLDAIERVEVYLRSRLAYMLAEQTGPFGFMDHKGLPRLSQERYERFINRCYSAYEQSKRGEPFSKHFSDKYGDEHALPPYWMLVNMIDFGTVVTLYKGASVDIRLSLAKDLGISTKVLDSWLVTINTVRNICCHHGRLWNRVIGNPPKLPKSEAWHVPFEINNDRIFGTLTVLSWLLERMAPDTHWRSRLFSLMNTLPRRYWPLMGFREGWDACPIWSPWLPDAWEDSTWTNPHSHSNT